MSFRGAMAGYYILSPPETPLPHLPSFGGSFAPSLNCSRFKMVQGENWVSWGGVSLSASRRVCGKNTEGPTWQIPHESHKHLLLEPLGPALG